MALQASVLLIVAVMTLVCLGQQEYVPSCDASKFTFVYPSPHPDLEKLQGRWFKKYVSYLMPEAPTYDGLTFDWGYVINADYLATITLAITKTNSKEDDCLPDEYWSCVMMEGGKCENNDYGPDYLAILAIDYNSTVGSFVAWGEFTGPDGLQYMMVHIFVKDPFNFPTLDDVIARAKLKDFCDPGADDPSSDFYQVVYPYENIPDCLLPA